MAQNKLRPVCFNLMTYKLYICSLPLTFGATAQLSFEIAHEPISALKSITKKPCICSLQSDVRTQQKYKMTCAT